MKRATGGGLVWGCVENDVGFSEVGRLTAQYTCDEVGHAVEEEEFRDVERFHEHGEAGCRDGGQGN